VPELADVVIADPPRAGLKQEAVDVISTTRAPHVMLVSCDAGALSRDSSLLRTAGYQLDQVDVLDMFPQTSHVEVVTGWIRY
jgi:23S rRNA (uracil1939-C5)-methyltransferase